MRIPPPSRPAPPSGTTTILVLASALVATACPRGQTVTPTIDCETEVSYQARRVEGSVGFGKFSGEVDTSVDAVRQIDQEVERYLARWKSLCAEYNAGVHTKDQYRVESQAMRNRMEELDQLLIQLGSAPDAHSYQAALKQLYTTAVPEPQRVGLDLALTIDATFPGESVPRPVRAGDSLPSGTTVSFSVQPTADAYVYLYQQSASGELSVMFPDERLALTNPIAGGQSVRIPPAAAGVYTLDDQDLGLERVYIVASLEPLDTLGHALAEPSATIDEVNCAARKFELTTGGRCDESRGFKLELADDGPGAVSMRATSAAGDSRILQVFEFMHTR